METKELKITIPEGCEIDKDKSTFEKIIFKKKEISKPRSWEEFCKKFSIKEKERTINVFGEPIIPVEIHNNAGHRYINTSFSILPNGEYVTAFTALMQLISLRQAWIGDWEPDWDDGKMTKWCIICYKNKVNVFDYELISNPLSFPTQEMAEDFMNCFKDLLEIAKPLI